MDGDGKEAWRMGETLGTFYGLGVCRKESNHSWKDDVGMGCLRKIFLFIGIMFTLYVLVAISCVMIGG